MRTNYHDISLLTLAQQQPHPATLCITVGILYDSQQKVIPITEALPWLTERFDGQPFDRGLKKYRGTFMVQGCAWPLTTDQQMQGMAVKVQVGEVSKTLHVNPPRRWEQGLLGWNARICNSLSSIPIDLKHSFGGPAWPDNPEGCGYEPNVNMRAGITLPQIEDEKAPLISPDQTPFLASFLPLPPQSRERRSYWGTVDEKWIQQRAPWPPLDCDNRWFDEVAQDQVNSDFWTGNEFWEAIGMHPEHSAINGRLPGFRPRLFIIKHAHPEIVEEPLLQLDTICLFPDAQRVLLLYRSEINVADPDGEDISALGAVCERQDMPIESAASWCERLWPSASPQQLSTPKIPPIVNTEAILQKMQGLLDARFSAFNAEQDKVQAKTQALQQRLGQPTLSTINRITPPVLSAISPLEKRPASPFDVKAMKAAINAEISKAKKAADQHVEKVAQQLNITTAQLQAKINAIKLTSPGSHDPTAIVDQLSLSPERKATLKAQIAEGVKKAKAVESEINSRIAAVLSKIAPAAPLNKAPPFIWTREALELNHSKNIPLQGERFINLDLSNIDLSQASLRHCLFDNCLLKGANLSETDLSECTLQNCDLTGANIQLSQLDGSLLQKCKLEKILFNNSSARYMMARDCQFTNSQIKNAKWSHTVLVDCCLKDVQAEKIDISSGCLQRCDLNSINLYAAHLDKLLLDNCEMDRANLAKSQLQTATCSAIKGDQVNLSYAQAQGIRFDGKCQLPRLCLDYANLHGASLQGAYLPGSSLREAVLNKALVMRCDISDSDGYHLIAHDADFTGSNLSRVCWQGANLLGARLRKVQLTASDLSGSNLHAVVCDGSYGTEVNLQDALLTRCRLKEMLENA